MLDLKDEYVRNYVFDPELLQRKDSIEMHKDRLEKIQKANRRYMKKVHSIDINKPMSHEELAAKIPTTPLDDEVYSFCTVNIDHKKTLKSPQMCESRTLALEFAAETPVRTFMFSPSAVLLHILSKNTQGRSREMKKN
jgi:hypothetical protein